MECFKTQKSTTKLYCKLLLTKPHVFDDYTVGRVFEVFGRQKDDLWLFEEQLARLAPGDTTVGSTP
jgi:hypothetical protein